MSMQEHNKKYRAYKTAWQKKRRQDPEYKRLQKLKEGNAKWQALKD